jgi:hypothetical protein
LFVRLDARVAQFHALVREIQEDFNGRASTVPRRTS